MAVSDKYTPALADEICERISQGETLRSICRDEGVPAFQRIYEWMARDSEFAERFAKARDVGFDAIAQECMEIADSKDEDAQSRKVRIWARLELLKKWDPKRYGELIKQQHSGPNGGPLEFTEIIRKIVK